MFSPKPLKSMHLKEIENEATDLLNVITIVSLSFCHFPSLIGWSINMKPEGGIKEIKKAIVSRLPNSNIINKMPRLRIMLYLG